MIDTQRIAHLVERAQIFGIRCGVESAQRIAPELHAEFFETSGGIVPFVGPGSPLSEAAGLGIFEDVSEAAIEQVTRFFRRRQSPPRVNVSPLASMELARLLARAGYFPVEQQNVLVCEIAAVPHERDARVEVCDDATAWGYASAAGFIGREPTADERLTGTIIASAVGVIALAVYADGHIVATGAMDAQRELAGLFAASTIPAARGRGLQTILIRDRLARAREMGATYAGSFAAVGSVSERNFRRCGFEVLYTRSVWEASIT